MKRFWLVLLSLGLVMAFSVSAFAVDVKVGAEYYVGGLYLNKVTVDNGFNGSTGYEGRLNSTDTAFFYQRLRVGTDFVVSPCLKLVTQFDALERIWGGARTSTSQYGPQANLVSDSIGTRAETENIAMRLAYVDYVSPIGLFKIGYQEDYVWGTVFGDRGNGTPAGQVIYLIQQGPFVGVLDYAKETSQSYSAVSSTGNPAQRYNASLTDANTDSWRIGGIYNFKGGEAGALLLWNRNATERGYLGVATGAGDNLQNMYLFDPYVKAKVGPVAIQAEVIYYFGDAAKYEGPAPFPTNTINISSLTAFVDATANFGMLYAGGSFAYLQGQNPSDFGNKVEGGVPGLGSAGLDWDPCLILFNTQTLGYWVGDIYGHSGSALDNEMMNAWFFQLRGGIKPTPQLDIMASISYAEADQSGFVFNGTSITTFPGKNYGTEIDITGTYKITNNLSYMLGAGYLFTGDYFKGYDAASNSNITDDFILINKLTLTF